VLVYCLAYYSNLKMEAVYYADGTALLWLSYPDSRELGTSCACLEGRWVTVALTHFGVVRKDEGGDR
jgi:hypothetical protein